MIAEPSSGGPRWDGLGTGCRRSRRSRRSRRRGVREGRAPGHPPFGVVHPCGGPAQLVAESEQGSSVLWVEPDPKGPPPGRESSVFVWSSTVRGHSERGFSRRWPDGQEWSARSLARGRPVVGRTRWPRGRSEPQRARRATVFNGSMSLWAVPACRCRPVRDRRWPGAGPLDIAQRRPAGWTGSPRWLPRQTASRWARQEFTEAKLSLQGTEERSTPPVLCDPCDHHTRPACSGRRVSLGRASKGEGSGTVELPDAGTQQILRLLAVRALRVADLRKTWPRMARWSHRLGNGPDLVLNETGLVICRRRTPRLVDCSKGMCWPVQCYGEVGGCGERSVSRVISLGAKTRNGGPQKPVPRLV